MGPAAAALRISAIARADGIIIGTIARANSCQMGFSSATLLSSFGRVPRRTIAARSSKWRMIGADPRNAIVPPR